MNEREDVPPAHILPLGKNVRDKKFGGGGDGECGKDGGEGGDGFEFHGVYFMALWEAFHGGRIFGRPFFNNPPLQNVLQKIIFSFGLYGFVCPKRFLLQI